MLAASVAPAGAAEPAPTGFTVRRIVNPRFRPPDATAPRIPPGATATMRALDHLRGHLVHLGPTGPQEQTLWELSAGEQGRSDRSVDFALTGARRRGRDELRTLALSGRSGAFSASLGDPDAVNATRDASFQRLRGALMRYEERGRPRVLALAGVTRPVPGLPQPHVALGGAAVEEVPCNGALLSASLFAAARERTPAPFAAGAGDTLPGGGLFGSAGLRVPLGSSRLSQEIGIQAHDLDGSGAIGVEHRLDWSLQTRTRVVALGTEQGSGHARTVGTDRLGAAPRHEERGSAQQRFAGGRAEAHVTGLVREGGDSTLAARTLQLGASGALGHSPWYAGGDAAWDRRRFLALEERRFAIYAGGVFGSGSALLARIERADRPGAASAVTALSEASVALARGIRLALEPRAGWSAGAFAHGDLTARLSVPTAGLLSRITGSITIGAGRETGFRGEVREAGIALALLPNPRDRGDLEVRRLDSGGRPVVESSASYELRRERYGLLGGRRGTLDTSRVTVRVTRSGNRSGVGDVLISLDGRDLRFTDADGWAEFENVPPGIHVVAIEERSLPEHTEVAGASRVFVTVERGRLVEPVEFRIGRPERRTRF